MSTSTVTATRRHRTHAARPSPRAVVVSKWRAYRTLGAALIACAVASNPVHAQAIGELATDLGAAIVTRDLERAKYALRGLVHLADDAPAVRVTAKGAAALRTTADV